MFLRIQPTDPTPIYLQIVEQVRRVAASGRLPAGERLPSVRGLAEKLLVNHNTVARAYRELERDGVVASRHGYGVFVADQASRFRASERAALLNERVDRLLTEASELRVELEDLITLVRNRADAKDQGTDGTPARSTRSAQRSDRSDRRRSS